MAEWNNYIMRKYGPSIRKKIAEAYMPFKKAHEIKNDCSKTKMVDYATKELGESE